ncbi:arabinosyltransferase domain-containing protein [Gemmatimonas sp.]|uniref:arabinosyltransferase domain-containing protein n=1 Tax=Gemmatimonas sp. TaxID=1962908 RepID=UPI003562C21D
MTLLAAVLASILPSEAATHDISWNSSVVDGGEGFVGVTAQIARHTPDALVAKWACESPSSSSPLSDKTLFTTGLKNELGMPLIILRSATGIRIIAGYTEIGALELSSEQLCALALNVSGRMVTVSAAGKTGSFTAPRPITVSSLIADAEAARSGLTVTATATVVDRATSPSPMQILLWIAAGSGALVLIVISRVQLAPRTRCRGTRPHIDWTDGVVATSLVLWCLVGPFLLDDGWVLQTAKFGDGFSNFFNVFQTWDARVPLGTPQYEVYRVITSVTAELIYLRILPLLAVLLGWWQIRWIRSRLRHRGQLGDLVAALSYLVVSFAWLITLRPEPFIACLSLVGARLAYDFIHSRRVDLILPLVIVGFSGPAIHTSGGVTAVPLAVAAAYHLRLRRTVSGMTMTILAAATVGAVVLLAGVFLGWDYHSWTTNAQAFESGVPARTWADEPVRYSWLFSSFPFDTVLRRASVLLALAVFASLALRRRSSRIEETFFALMLLGGLVALMITPTKWPWHFGSIAGLTALAFSVEFGSWRRKATSTWFSGLGLVLVLAGICVVSFRSPDRWGDFFPVNLRSGRPEAIVDLLSSPLAIGIVIAASVAGGAIWTSQRGKPLCGALVAVPFLLSMLFVPVALDVAGDLGDNRGIAISQMNARGLAQPNGDHCGLGSRIHLVDPSRSTSLDYWQNGTTPSTRSDRAVSGRQRNILPPDDASGETITTGWYRLPEESTTLIVDANGDLAGQGSLSVEYAADPRESLEEFNPLIEGLSHINGTRVIADIGNHPPAAEFFRLRVAGPADSILLGVPRSVRARSVAELNRAGYTFQIDPFYKPVFPCVGEPTFAESIATRPDFVIGGFPTLPNSAGGLLADIYDVVELPGTSGSTTFLTARWFDKTTFLGESTTTTSSG